MRSMPGPTRHDHGASDERTTDAWRARSVQGAAADWTGRMRSPEGWACPGMEWAVTLPGGPPPFTPRRRRCPIVTRWNAQLGELGPVDQWSSRAGGTGQGRGLGVGGILRCWKRRPAGPARAGPRRRREAGGLGLLPRKERARRAQLGWTKSGPVPGGGTGTGSLSRGSGGACPTAARAGGGGRGRCDSGRRGQRARVEE